MDDKDLSAYTSPPLANVSTATFAVPFKTSFPACPPASVPFASGAPGRLLQFKAGCRRGRGGRGWAGGSQARAPLVGSGHQQCPRAATPLQVLLFPAATNFTSPDSGEEMEMLAGNTKTLLTIHGWCLAACSGASSGAWNQCTGNHSASPPMALQAILRREQPAGGRAGHEVH